MGSISFHHFWPRPLRPIYRIECGMLYRQQSITHKISSCKFQLDSLGKLVDLATRLHDDCVKQLKQDLSSTQFLQKGIDHTSQADIDAKVDAHFKLMIEVFGIDGEYLNILSLNEISSTVDLPHKISKVRINNASIYEFYFGNRPSVHFEVTIDFRSTRVFDLISGPSHSTFNESKSEVVGQNSTLVNGLSAHLEKFFSNFKTHHGFLHAENIYDVLLWLGFFPLLLAYLVKYQSKIPDLVTTAPVVVQVIVSLTVFFILALFFRLLFNLGRWLYPYMEITDQTRKERIALKAFYSLIVVSILGAIAVHIANFFWEALVG